MVELTRRRFFFGMGAVAAMAALPTVPGVAMIASPPPLPYLHRRIMGMMVGFEDVPANVSGAGSIELIVRGKTFFQGAISVHGTLLWRPIPLAEPIVMPGDLFEVDVRSQVGIGSAQFMIADKVDDGPPVKLWEIHTFPRDGERTIIQHHLEMDNSFGARMARQKHAEEADAEYARKVASGEILEENYDDEYLENV